ncbi:MAG: ferritin-like domain-containing protein, partial [Chitinophagales bacterium]
KAFQRLIALGSDVALAAIPAILITGLPKKARAESLDVITDVLNFALTLEYLESTYYSMGLSSGVIAASDLAIFQTINAHEAAHVSVLASTISSLGGTPVAAPGFDFTAGGLFAPFSDYPTFLALSQAFEDTGVRAYKGQAANLISNNDILTAALQIHSVEARHAAEVRKLRTAKGLDTVKPWITGNERGTLPSEAQAVYDGEQNSIQGGVDVKTITTVGTGAVQEAFDEPLTDTEVLAIAGLFLV